MKTISRTHYYLYAKGFYKQTNIIEDLKKIMSHVCLLEQKYIKPSDIAEHLFNTLFPNDSSQCTYNNHIHNFMRDINPKYWYLWKDESHSEYDFDYAVIRKCLQLMNHTKVNETDDKGNIVPIIKLDNPDEDVLPVLRKNINLDWR